MVFPGMSIVVLILVFVLLFRFMTSKNRLKKEELAKEQQERMEALEGIVHPKSFLYAEDFHMPLYRVMFILHAKACHKGVPFTNRMVEHLDDNMRALFEHELGITIVTASSHFVELKKLLREHGLMALPSVDK